MRKSLNYCRKTLKKSKKKTRKGISKSKKYSKKNQYIKVIRKRRKLNRNKKKSYLHL